MSARETSPSVAPNGSGAAAILAAGIGSFILAVFAIAGDRIPVFGKSMIFYKPTGPLSGVTTSAIIIWLAAWVIFDRAWSKRSVPLARISTVALVLLVLSLLLMFPPIADLF